MLNVACITSTGTNPFFLRQISVVGEFVGWLLGELVVGEFVGWLLGEVVVGKFIG
jgi:hypothetical protein